MERNKLPVDYQALLDEAKTLVSRIEALNKIIKAREIPYMENITIALTDAQLAAFTAKRDELKTRKDEICDTVKAL